MKRRFLLTVGLALSGAACATVRPRSETARCDVGATAAPVDVPVQLSALVGDFAIFMIDTTVADSGSSSPLHLALPDSAQQAYAATRSPGNYRPRKLQLVGSQKWNPQRPAESAELSDNVLYLGCRDCTDASPDILTISAMGPGGFTGSWRNGQTGIVRRVDANGNPGPDPAGYFCAKRQGL